MAGNGGGGSSRGGATAIGSADTRFRPQLRERRNKWGGCFGLSCFGLHKEGKRIVPASRIPDGNASTSNVNGLSNQSAPLNLSLLAPPSSPASFINSALPSTAQSPSCFLSISANSPGGPSSTMFATGPYAHETQLVSPPVFSTFTTEPSTAPLTPPPELAHLTTPSSPDVPFARFLSSSAGIKGAGKENAAAPFLSSHYPVGSDLQATYPLYYPGSPSSSLISPASATPRTGLSSPFPEKESVPTQWNTSISACDSPRVSSNSKLFGLDSATSRKFMLLQKTNFFCPATSAQFFLDQAQQSLPYGGRLSVSREGDVYSNGGNRHTKNSKQDVEEVEAYRASFGFSADEIIATQNYVEIADAADESFTMSPFASSSISKEHNPVNELTNEDRKMALSRMQDCGSPQKVTDQLVNGAEYKILDSNNAFAASKPNTQSKIPTLLENGHASIEDEETPPKSSEPHERKIVRSSKACSDAEIDYRRARSIREANSILAWRNSLP
ncbi:uncharacterized protein At1g76660 [Ananas comosus]|uniref:Uncharacterized protein At1g76660 n=1 Tax=Ananas comosus TaxID=4615 RepID=A0A6P5FAW6_ANACO|nr:uncharacterized protein At1g76660 [Ananas comosus]